MRRKMPSTDPVPSHLADAAADTGTLGTKFYHVSNTALLVAAPLAIFISPSPWVFPVRSSTSNPKEFNLFLVSLHSL